MPFFSIEGVPVRVPDGQARRMEPLATGGGVARAIDMTPRSTAATNPKDRFQMTTIEYSKADRDALVAAIGTPGVQRSCNGYLVGNVATMCYITWTESYHHVASTTETNHVLELQVEVA